MSKVRRCPKCGKIISVYQGQKQTAFHSHVRRCLGLVIKRRKENDICR